MLCLLDGLWWLVFVFILPLREEASSHTVLSSSPSKAHPRPWKVLNLSLHWRWAKTAAALIAEREPPAPTWPPSHSRSLSLSPNHSTHEVFNTSYKWHLKNSVYSSLSVSHYQNIFSTRSGNWFKVKELALVVWLSHLPWEPGTVWCTVSSQ